MPRPLRFTLSLLWLACLGGASAATRSGVDLVAADSRRVLVSWRPSSSDLSRLGLPESNGRGGFLVAIPPGKEPTLRVLADRWVDYALVPTDVVSRLPPAPMRLAERIRVGDFDLVRVETAAVTVATGQTLPRLHTQVDAEVLFTGAAEAIGTRTRGNHGASGGSDAGGGVSGPVARAVRAAAVNGREASPSPRATAVAGFGFAPAKTCSNCLKIEVAKDGVYLIEHTDLLAVPGFDLTGLDPRLLHVYSGGRELTIEVEGEADGSFDPGDRIVFVGQRSRSLLSATSVYWLVPELTPGRRMRRRVAVPPGREVTSGVAVVRDVVRLEEQNSQYIRMPDADGKDTWMANLLASNEFPESVTVPTAGGVDLADLAQPHVGQSYSLRVHVVGVITGGVVDDQELSVAVNGGVAYTARWNLSTTLDTVLSGSLNPLLLRSSGNVFELTQPAPADVTRWRVNYIDWVEFDYPRRLVAANGTLSFPVSSSSEQLYYMGGFSRGDILVYEVDAAGDAVRLDAPRVIAAAPGLPVTLVAEARGPGRIMALETGALLRPDRIYLDVPSDWRGFAGSQYVIVAHPRFVAESAALATYRGGIVVSLEDVYDEFSYGMESEQALRDFFTLASSSWSTPPEYVLLVGDATQDPRNHLGLIDAGYDPPNLVPMREVYLDSVLDLRAASDTWFAAVAGGDFVPDFAIGRLPVRTAGSVTSYVQKLQRYEAQPDAPWMQRVALFADDDAQNCGRPGYFADDLEALAAAYALNPVNLDRQYAGNFAAPNAPGNLRAAVLSSLSDGVGVQVYSGHGNVVSMAKHCDNPNLSILDFPALGQINNGDRLAFGVAMTCDAGEFDFAAMLGPVPTYESIAERYLLAADRGYVGWLATTTVLLYSTGLDLMDDLFQVLYAGGLPAPENRILGEVGLGVMLSHFAQAGTASRDALETLVVLGDPATKLRATTP